MKAVYLTPKPGKSLSILGRIAYFGTLLAILIVAIPQGTIDPWHKGLFVTTISALGMLRVADGVVNSDFRIAEPLLLLPLIGIIGLAFAQLVPISPDYQVSLDSYQTQSFIVVFGSLIVCAELLFNYTRSNTHLRQLVGLVLIIAIASSLFGLIHHLLESSELDPFASSFGTGQGYAQFTNRNHFAVLAEMGFGLLSGLLLKGELRLTWRLLGWTLWGILFYSIIAASSRGGMASLTVMAIFTVFVHVMTRSGPAPASRSQKPNRSAQFKLPAKIATAVSLCLLSFGIIVVLVAFIGGDAVVTRIEQIDREVATLEQSRVNRAAIWESTFRMIRESPVLGSGFGAYGAAITKYDSSNGHFLLEQAHNDYLEIVANGGAVGAILFIVFAVFVGARLMNNMLSSDGFRRASCFGSIVGIVGVLIHSFVDFGLHVLVNALVFTALIVIGTSSIERADGASSSNRFVRP